MNDSNNIIFDHNCILDNSTTELSMESAIKYFLINPSQKDNNNTICTTLKIATGYWDLPGIALIADELKAFLEKKGNRFQLLIGKDPSVTLAQVNSSNAIDDGDLREEIRIELGKLEPKEQYKDSVALLIKYLNESIDENGDSKAKKIQVRLYTNKENKVEFLHSKCYVFARKGKSIGIIGSSNFTGKGLSGNREANYLEINSMIVAAEPNEHSKHFGHNYWFDQIWEGKDDWSKEFLLLLESSQFGKMIQREKEEQSNKEDIQAPVNSIMLPPYEAYIKLLQNNFSDLLDSNIKDKLRSYLTSTISPYDFQLEAVIWCYRIMKRHQGFMLGDVVGLGKTVTALLLVKYFIETNSKSNNKDVKVLIITPPAIQRGWKDTIKLFDEGQSFTIADKIELITIGRVKNLIGEDPDDDSFEDIIDDYYPIDNEDDDDTTQISNQDTKLYDNNNKVMRLNQYYDLIIIDESHRYRNNNSFYESINKLIDNTFSSTGKYPYIGLLSATLLNNNLNDLLNQIKLFQRTPKKSTLDNIKAKDLTSYFNKKSKEVKEIKNKIYELQEEGKDNDQEKRKEHLNELIKLNKEIRDDVLKYILVRRTRADVIKSKANDLSFPKVNGPMTLKYEMDPSLQKLFYGTMERIAPTLFKDLSSNTALQYYRYRAIEYLNPEHITKYTKGSMTAEKTSERLAKLMEILFVKRLESSIDAFKASLKNLSDYNDVMLDMINNDAIYIGDDLKVNDTYKKLKGDFNAFKEAMNKKIKELQNDGTYDKDHYPCYKASDFKEDYKKNLSDESKLINGLIKEWDKYKDDPKLTQFIKTLKVDLLDKNKNPEGKLVIFTEALATFKLLKEAIEKEGYKVLDITAKNRKEKEEIIRQNFDANYLGEQKDDYKILISTDVLAEGVNLHRANTLFNYDTPWNPAIIMQRIGRVNRIGSPYNDIFVYNYYPSDQGEEKIKYISQTLIKLQSFHTLLGEDNQVYNKEEILFKTNLNEYNDDILSDEEESEETQYITELKEYKDNYQQRYEELLNIKEPIISQKHSDADTTFIALATDTAVKKYSYFKVDLTNKVERINNIDMIKETKCDITTPLVDIRKDYKSLQDKAISVYKKTLVSPIIQTNNNSKDKRKQNICLIYLNDLTNNYKLDDEACTYIKNTNKLIRGGNSVAMNKVNQLESDIENKLRDDSGDNTKIVSDLIIKHLNINKINIGDSDINLIPMLTISNIKNLQDELILPNSKAKVYP